MKYFFVILFFCIPSISLASVRINEVAWMGSVESATDEWIELFNDGAEAVSLEGWRIEDGVSFSVDLSGSISSKQFAVLERTDDSSAQGAAFLIFSGALSNEGRTLTLTDGNGVVIDRVVGGKNWENIGGDNVTKETAQRTSSKWITAPSTPGVENAQQGTSRIESEKTSTTEETDSSAKKILISSKSQKKSTVIELFPSSNELSLSIEMPERAVVGQEVVFHAVPQGITPELFPSIQYEWNFGDAQTGTSSDVRHIYAHPGRYIVFMRGRVGEREGTQKEQIEVVRPTLSLGRNDEDKLFLRNTGEFEIDVSLYRVKGDVEFVFPPHSYLLPNENVVIPGRFADSPFPTLYDLQNTKVAGMVSPEKEKQPAQLSASSLQKGTSQNNSETSLPETMPENVNMEKISSPALSLSYPKATSPTDSIIVIGKKKEDGERDSEGRRYERLPFLALVAIIFAGYILYLRGLSGYSHSDSNAEFSKKDVNTLG